VLAAFPDASVVEVAEGWEQRWRAFHRPVTIGPLWIGPPWEEPPPGALAVVIDPGRAFGTGAHASTRLCVELLLGERRGSLVDVGCGSGVLALAALRLGFGPVTAVDVDPVAVAVTRSNARANGLDLDVRRLDARTGAAPAADLAAANLSLEAVEAAGPALAVQRLIAAGYLVGDRPRLRPFRRLARRQLDGWAADLYARR
jgi:ribosomal protein L11 methyltransferase